MNFNVYLDDELVRRLDALAKRTGARRNTLVRQAVAIWVQRAGSSWPAKVLEWAGDARAPAFEALRDELAPPSDDPFATQAPSPRPQPRKRNRTRPR